MCKGRASFIAGRRMRKGIGWWHGSEHSYKASNDSGVRGELELLLKTTVAWNSKRRRHLFLLSTIVPFSWEKHSPLSIRSASSLFLVGLPIANPQPLVPAQWDAHHRMASANPARMRTGQDRSRFSVVCVGKDMQVVIWQQLYELCVWALSPGQARPIRAFHTEDNMGVCPLSFDSYLLGQIPQNCWLPREEDPTKRKPIPTNWSHVGR